MRDETEILGVFQQQTQRIVEMCIRSNISPGWDHDDEWPLYYPYCGEDSERYRQIYQNSIEYCRRLGYCLDIALNQDVDQVSVLMLWLIAQQPIKAGEDLQERIEQLGQVHEDYLRPRRPEE